MRLRHSPPRMRFTSSAVAWYDVTAHISESSLSVSDISITAGAGRLAGGRGGSADASTAPRAPLLTASLLDTCSVSLLGELIVYAFTLHNTKYKQKRRRRDILFIGHNLEFFCCIDDHRLWRRRMNESKMKDEMTCDDVLFLIFLLEKILSSHRRFNKSRHFTLNRSYLPDGW